MSEIKKDAPIITDESEFTNDILNELTYQKGEDEDDKEQTN